MSEKHRIAGLKGVQALVKKLGTKEAVHNEMSRRGKLGGRPTWQETLAKGEKRHLEAVKRMRYDRKGRRSVHRTKPESSQSK